MNFFLILFLCSVSSVVQCTQNTGPFYTVILNLQQEIQHNVIQQIIEQFVNFIMQAFNMSRFNFTYLMDQIHSFLPQMGEALLYQIRNLIAAVLTSSVYGQGNRIGEEVDQLLDNFQDQIQNFMINSLHFIFPDNRNLLSLFNSFGIRIENILDSLKPKIIEVINQISNTLDISSERNSIIDYIINSFGLGQVWSIIQSLGNQVVIQFTNIAAQLLFAGQQIWNSAQDIFNNLKDELLNHTVDAVFSVASALNSLNNLLILGGK